jgi:hypothetical protein
MMRLSSLLTKAIRLDPTFPRSFATATSSTRNGNGLQNLLQKNPNDVVITLALRTPLCRAKKGGLKDTTSDELLLGLLKAVKEKSMIDPGLVEDIAIGESGLQLEIGGAIFLVVHAIPWYFQGRVILLLRVMKPEQQH